MQTPSGLLSWRCFWICSVAVFSLQITFSCQKSKPLTESEAIQIAKEYVTDPTLTEEMGFAVDTSVVPQVDLLAGGEYWVILRDTVRNVQFEVSVYPDRTCELSSGRIVDSALSAWDVLEQKEAIRKARVFVSKPDVSKDLGFVIDSTFAVSAVPVTDSNNTPVYDVVFLDSLKKIYVQVRIEPFREPVMTSGRLDSVGR